MPVPPSWWMHVQRLHQPDEVAHVGVVAGAPAAIEIAGEGGPAGGDEDQAGPRRPSTSRPGCARACVKRGGALAIAASTSARDRAHALGAAIHLGAGLLEDVAAFVMQHLEARSLQQPRARPDGSPRSDRRSGSRPAEGIAASARRAAAAGAAARAPLAAPDCLLSPSPTPFQSRATRSRRQRHRASMASSELPGESVPGIDRMHDGARHMAIADARHRSRCRRPRAPPDRR